MRFSVFAGIAMAGAVFCVGSTCRVSAQVPPIEVIKSLYLAAEYEQALEALDALPPDARTTSSALYRLQCLIALDRKDAAQAAIETIVRADPLYRLPEGSVSPRVETTFAEGRAALLPTILQAAYADAKRAFDQHAPEARERFEHVLALLDDPDFAALPTAADLRTVARAFRDLIAVRAKPSPPVQGRTPTDGVAVEGSQGVVPPVPISQTMPKWTRSSADAMRIFTGTLEFIVGTDGTVESARLQEPIHPQFDANLLRAARSWTYKPATRDGVPTRYLMIMRIELRPSAP